jgi:hypothetical protein
LNGVSVCEISKKVERPYPDHYWIIPGTSNFGKFLVLQLVSHYNTRPSLILNPV